MKRAYFCWVGDDECGVSIVAFNRNHARHLAQSYLEGSWIEIHTNVKPADVRDLSLGLVENWEGLERGLYGYLIDELCPRCHRPHRTVSWDGDYYCSSCEGEEILTAPIDLFEDVDGGS